jgi:hypothetical protein
MGSVRKMGFTPRSTHSYHPSLAGRRKVATVLEVKELGGEYSAKEYDP